MKTNVKKIVTLSIAIISLVATGLCYFPVSALTFFTMRNGSYGVSTTNKEQGYYDFNDEWHTMWKYTYKVPSSHPDYGDVEVSGSMEIGFLGNKDFVRYYGNELFTHYAVVQNSDAEMSYTNTATAGWGTGIADVKHTGTPVRYYAIWEM